MASEHRELIPIIRLSESASYTPDDFLMKLAVRCYLEGVDAEATVKQLSDEYRARMACRRARLIMNNVRAKLRKHVNGRPSRKKREFTFENFRITIDTSQSKDYGMVNVSIYCTVEVFLDDDEVEKEYLINFSDYKTKEWLIRLLVWGLMNKREIILRAATEQEMASMKMFIPKERNAA